MAPNNVYLLFLFIALVIAPTLLHQATAIDVSDKWCGQTTHKALCMSIIRSDKRAELKTSPNGIAYMLNDLALRTAASTEVKIVSLLSKENKQHKIASLKSCFEGYERAISSLRSADFRAMIRETYTTMVAAVSNANDVPRDCELSFQEAPAVPSPISADNERLREINAITLEMINLVVCKSTSFCFVS